MVPGEVSGHGRRFPPGISFRQERSWATTPTPRADPEAPRGRRCSPPRLRRQCGEHLEEPRAQSVHFDAAEVSARRAREHGADLGGAHVRDVDEAVPDAHDPAGGEVAEPRSDQLAAARSELGCRAVRVDVEIDRDQLAPRVTARLQRVGVDREVLAVERILERCFELRDPHARSLPAARHWEELLRDLKPTVVRFGGYGGSDGWWFQGCRPQCPVRTPPPSGWCGARAMARWPPRSTSAISARSGSATPGPRLGKLDFGHAPILPDPPRGRQKPVSALYSGHFSLQSDGLRASRRHSIGSPPVPL